MLAIERRAQPVVRTSNGRVKAASVVLAGNATSSWRPGACRGRCFRPAGFIIASRAAVGRPGPEINPLDMAFLRPQLRAGLFSAVHGPSPAVRRPL